MEQPNHHLPDGGFRNPWRSAKSHGFIDFLRWSLVERRQNPRRPDPDPGSFARATPQFTRPRANTQAFTLTWIGHTTFLVQIGGINVLLDPIWSERASPVGFAGPRRRVPAIPDFDQLPPIDLVCLSHDHYDHLDAPTVSRLTKRYPAAVWYAPIGVGAFLRRRGAADVRECDWWNAGEDLGLQLTCVPAQHFSGRSLGRRNRTLWCGWVIHSETHSVLFAGDTALHPEFGEIARRTGPFDLAILPIGAYDPRWFMGSVHMNPEDALAAFETLQSAQAGKLVLAASHWGTFKLTDEPMDEPPRRMTSAWRDAGLPANDLWIMQHGETRALRAPSAQPSRSL